MPVPEDGAEPIAADEILYRRIPVSMDWYQPHIDSKVSRFAFNPIDKDIDGLSLTRAKYHSVEQAARGRPSKFYYVGKLKASALFAHGIQVKAAPIPGVPGHAIIPALTYSNRKSDAAESLKLLLAEKLCYEILGPFETPLHN